MEEINIGKFFDDINLFLKNKNIQLDSLIVVCLIIFLISENNSDYILLGILFLLIF